ncbi:hypothetical protein [Turicimonas muris]|uniref:hypothetical protein n=1 Tax=Turicimonas muris TaxID=1796652 RepID=UPI002630C99B|nr:hypothetical protein [Turicimonas muris]
MFKDTVTYEDYNGNMRTETLYFNLSRAEVIQMEMSVNGGLGSFLENIVKSEDMPAIVEQFTKIIKMSYGVKSDDGKRFIKSDEISETFVQSEAFSEFFIKIISDENYAAKFVNGIMPKVENRQTVAPSS